MPDFCALNYTEYVFSGENGLNKPNSRSESAAFSTFKYVAECSTLTFVVLATKWEYHTARAWLKVTKLCNWRIMRRGLRWDAELTIVTVAQLNLSPFAFGSGIDIHYL